MILHLKAPEDFEIFLKESAEKPAFLFKHSTACSTSARAWKAFSQFAESQTNAVFGRVLAIEDRQLSLEIAADSGIRHQSPQVILFYKGKPVWNESHGAINEESLSAGLKGIS